MQKQENKSTSNLIRHAQVLGGQHRLLTRTHLLRGPEGEYMGTGVGSSIEFHDYSEYQPGDDLRRVDWRVYARSNSMVLRRYQVEVSPVVEILLDESASIGLYEGKRAAAVFTAALLAGAARASGGRPVLVAGGRRYLGSDFERYLLKTNFNSEQDPSLESWPRGSERTMRFLISDFLFPAPMGRFLSSAGQGSASLVLVQILANQETSPSMSGSFRLLDAENHNNVMDLLVDRRAVGAYKKRLKEHLAQLDDAARRLHAPLVRFELPDDFKSPEALSKQVFKGFVRENILEAT